MPLWTLIPALFLVTLIYLGLGIKGYWNYTEKDLIFGNLLVMGIVGKGYLIEHIYKRFKK